MKGHSECLDTNLTSSPWAEIICCIVSEGVIGNCGVTVIVIVIVNVNVSVIVSVSVNNRLQTPELLYNQTQESGRISING